MNFICRISHRGQIRPILTQDGLIKLTKKALATYLIFSIVALSSGLIYLFSPSWFGKEVEAAWVDDDWGYRQEVPVTSTNGSAQSNVFVSFSLDTATLITAGKLQSSCQDIRITTQAGEILPYHVGRTNACNASNTTIDFLLSSFPDLKSTYYVYYGNPSAVSADAGAFSQSQASNYTVGSLGTEAKAPAPVGYWKFDDAQGTTPQDSSTNNSDGSFSGAPSWQSEDMCVSSKCLKFDGSDDYVSLSHPTSLDVQSAFTLSAWVKPTSTPTGAGVITETYSGGSDKVQFELGFGISTGTDSTLRVGFYSGTTWYVASDAGGNSSAGDWMHVVGSWDGTTLKVYKNGKLVGSSTPGVSAGVDTEAIRIGIRHDTAGYFPGFIDDVKIYNFAQTAAQIQANYDSKASKEGASGVLGTSIQNNPKALSNGLVGYWKLDESSLTQDCTTYDATDSSGYGDPARSCPSTTGPAGGAAGKYGRAVDFDGTNDFLNVGNSESLNLTSAFTLSAWIYPDAITGSARPLIIREQNSNNITYLLYIDTTSGQLGLNIKNGSSNNTALLSTNNLTASAWNHVAGVYDGSNMKVFINGVLENTTTIAYSPPSTTGGPQTEFGDSSVDSFWGQFDGKMDEVRIYNRALNAAEVKDLYNFAPGPVLYYKFDDGSGTTPVDSSGNANTGSFTSSPVWSPGKFGKSLKFDGSDDLVATTSNPVTTFSNTTFSAWVNFPSIPASQKYFAGSANNHWRLDFNTGGGTNNLGGCVGGSIGVGCNTGTINFQNISANTWYYATLASDSTTTYFYVNGVLIGSQTTGSFGNGVIDIGGAFGSFANAYVDEFKVYNYARNAKQIIEDMNANHPAPGSPVGSAVAYWRFDEGYGTTANDSSVNSNSLTLNTASWSIAGKFGKAWNGTGGAIRMSRATDSDLEFSATDDFTVSGWFKTDSATNPSTTEYLVSDTTAHTDVGFEIYANTDGTICFGIDDDTTWTPDVASCSSGDFYDGTWHYFTAVRDVTADTTRLYIDAISRDSDTDSTTATLDGNNTFRVGDIDTNDDGEEFSGDIDELKVYRSALTAQQVALDMNRGQSQVLGALGDNSGSAIRSASQEYCVPGSSDTCTAPVGRWDLNEGSGTTINDSSGGGFSGSFTGASYTSGKVGKALDFNGSSSTMTTPDLGTITAFTIEFWIKHDATTSNVEMVMEDSVANSSPSFESASAGSSTFNFWINNTDSMSTTLPVGQWHHIALVYSDAGNIMALYRDGLGTQQTTTQTDTLNNALDWAYRNGWSLNANVTLDNIRIYDYVRTASQIAYDYNQGEPVAHWRMDECQGTTINDSSGNSNTGTLTVGVGGSEDTVGTCTTSSTVWGDGATGKRNYALGIGSDDDYVNVGSGSSLNISGDMTITGWVYPDVVGGALVSNFNSGGTVGQYRLEFVNGNTLEFLWNSGGCEEKWYLSGFTFTAGQWYHLAAVRTSSDVSAYYVNGKSYTPVINSGNCSVPTSSFGNTAIGRNGDESARYTDGLFDDIRIYNYSLTATQVKQLYNGGTTRYGPSTGAP